MDRRYLRRIAEHHAGGPVGVETLAAALAEARDTLEDVIEPFLIQEGLVLRTSRGRMLGEPGWRHLGLPIPPASPGSSTCWQLDPPELTAPAEGDTGVDAGAIPGSSARARCQGTMNERTLLQPLWRRDATRYTLRVYLRGHRRRRRGLPRQLPALRGAGAHRSLARSGNPPCDAGGAIWADVRGAAHQSGLSATRPARRIADRGNASRCASAARRWCCARTSAAAGGTCAVLEVQLACVPPNGDKPARLPPPWRIALAQMRDARTDGAWWRRRSDRPGRQTWDRRETWDRHQTWAGHQSRGTT